MAGTTGLEPATSDVTGRRSNQLSYVPIRKRPSFENSIVAWGPRDVRNMPSDSATEHGVIFKVV